MDPNPYRPPANEGDVGLPETKNAKTGPVCAYTASGNIEAHSIVMWLESNGVRAHVVEDNSGLSNYAFGTLSQFHQPQVFVDSSDLLRASEFLRQYELQQKERLAAVDDTATISSKCEECGQSSDFPISQKGTTQDCPKCAAFMDVGAVDWPFDDDFGIAETEQS